MGASEQETVDLRVPKWREQSLGEHMDLIRFGLAPLDELDESRAGGAGEGGSGGDLAGEPLVRATADGADRADHPDPAGDGDFEQRSEAGFEHSDDRYVDHVLELFECDRRRGVAGHHDHLRVVGRDEPACDLPGEPSEPRRGLRGP